MAPICTGASFDSASTRCVWTSVANPRSTRVAERLASNGRVFIALLRFLGRCSDGISDGVPKITNVGRSAEIKRAVELAGAEAENLRPHWPFRLRCDPINSGFLFADR